MKEESKPASRRWRGLAIATAAAALLSAGVVAANAATVDRNTGGNGTRAAAIKNPTGGAKGVPGLANAANAFLSTLTDEQKAKALLEFTEENATAWSNLPCADTCRPGVGLGDLDEDQLTLAKAVLKAATGTGTGTGFDQIQKIVAADEVLAGDAGSGAPGGGAPSADPSASVPADAPSGGPPGGGGDMPGLTYGSDYYYLAFLGTPSATGTWELNFGGHHLAVHLTYEKGKVTSASPFFLGVEPISYTTEDGTVVEAMAAQKKAVTALANGLTTAQKTSATLDQSFTDVLVGPQKDGQFPETKSGLAVKSLNAKQKKLVLDVVRQWVGNADDATTAQLMKTYETELNQTFVGLSGGTGYDTQGDYLRIDGPGVWIEFVCQNGVVYNTEIHYHTVYRDHVRDYGAEFAF
ncbi:DUF3500 domain-containing protein [Actinoplanes couchii]|uniref:DUF3500 domain-containing protein n=1 Tax=Actinoplanes couchii TaxID=403638 RepID=A0ABQ3XSH4_9ACTN|nr:DUF3500 domain-containing protein [Actinoplanes couchii]MDR6320062.1 hypothetical protein [Actinoplanes couchii]GID61467.1 hypothetical protein Aco03nite_098710 [Actinoplanes couchii]